MSTTDRGNGPPIVVVPSLQGRWEYLAPAIDALAQTHRVISFSLRSGDCLDSMVGRLESALDERGLRSAAICGVSFGGRVALRFAARRPERTDALVLVSVPGPGWHLRPSHRLYARFPRLFAPLFFAAMPARLWAEIAAAIPEASRQRAFVRQQFETFLRAPLSPSGMGARALLIDGLDVRGDCAAVSAPTLVVAGEPALDHVVPADGSCEFAQLIPDARAVTLEHTGHLGSITRPAAFAGLVTSFLADAESKKP